MLAEIDQFVNWVRRRNSQARTWKDYGYDLRQFAALVGDVPPGTITFREVDRFVDLQKTRGFLPTTINRRLATLISFFTYLSDDDPALICPVLPRRHTLRERERLPRPVQEEGLRAFFSAIEHTPPAKGEPDNRVRDRAMFILMLRCGLRIGEVANLLLTHLYLDEAHPRLVAWGKGSRERSVYLSPQAERALRALPARTSRSGQRARLPQLPTGGPLHHRHPQTAHGLPQSGAGLPHRPSAAPFTSPTIS